MHFGRELLHMCFNTGLTAANGRLSNSTDGIFNFCANKGKMQMIIS
jgi:hypothetical protein